MLKQLDWSSGSLGAIELIVHKLMTVSSIRGMIWLQLLWIVGCGNQPDLLPVHGKVTFPDQTPLPGGWVEMEPLDGQKGSPRGPIAEDGTFSIGTFQPGDGAPLGNYAVLVVPPPGPHPERPNPVNAVDVKIDPRFSDFDTSELEFEVDPNRSENRLDIIVQRPK